MKVFKVLLLVNIVFITGCTYNGNTNIDYEASVAESNTDNVTVFVEPTSYKPMITYEDINYPSEPKTVEDFEKVFLYMANQGILELELHYATVQDDTILFENGSDGFYNIAEKYIELFSNVREYEFQTWSTSSSYSLTIKLSNNAIDDITLLSQEQEFQQKAKQINNTLHEKNIIRYGMTQKEVAEELFTYVTRTLKYDFHYYKESYTGYGAVKNGTAVCQGYTALYNYLLKLNGIKCEGQEGEMLSGRGGHIWTVAVLDGETCYIDATFGDSMPDLEGYTNYGYFDISKEDLSQDRTGVE